MYRILVYFALVSLCINVNAAVCQWIILDNLKDTYVNHIFAKSDTIYCATGGEGFFYSLNNGESWSQSNNGLGKNTFATSVTEADGLVFLSTISSRVFRSVAPGNSWAPTGSGISQLSVVDIISDSDAVYAGCSLAGVFRSTNSGKNWSRYALGEGDVLYCLHKDEAGFYVGLAGGGVRSTNNGANWSFFGSGLLNSNLHSIVSKPGVLFAGTSNGFFLSDDIGSSWNQRNIGLPSVWLNDLVVANGLLMAAVRNSGVYYSANDGLLWLPLIGGLSDSNITCLAVSDDHVFAGSNRGNIFRTPFSSLPVNVNTGIELEPKGFRLKQNYPNPFNPVTSISFELSKKSFVRLEVFDINGRKVAELFSGEKSAGNHNISFSGNEHSGGVYFCRLLSENSSESVRMILVK